MRQNLKADVRKKAVTAALLVAALLFAGCGRKEAETAQAGAGQTVTQEEPTPEDAAKTRQEADTADSLQEEAQEVPPPEAPGETASIFETVDASAEEASTQAAEGRTLPESLPESLPEDTGEEGNGFVIVLDPGHASKISGEQDPLGPGSSEMKARDTYGTKGVATGLTEYELNLTIARKLRTELEARGYTVLLTREDNDTQVGNVERAMIANDANADVFLRIHANGAESSAVHGAMTICTTANSPFVPGMYRENRRLSDAVLNAYCAKTGAAKERVWETDSMTGNNWSEVPTTLLEMGYMTNPDEDRKMADEAYQTKMVEGIADGIDAYLQQS